jgi:urease accessory protein
VKAHGSIVVAPDVEASRSILQSAHSEPPFSIRQCGEQILVAASAAAPVGGDELSLSIVVLAGARAEVGAVASTIVLPGPTGLVSTMSTQCTVGMDAHIDWIGEPTVSVAGSDHTITTTVDLDETATCRVVEEVSLGRSGEPSGRLRLVLRVVRGGRPLVHHDEEFGPDVPGAGSVISNGGAHHVLSEVLVGVDAGEPRVSVTDGCRVAWLPVAADVVMILAVGPDRPSVRAAVADLRT